MAVQKREIAELQVANDYLLKESNVSPVVAKVLAQKNQFRSSVLPSSEINEVETPRLGGNFIMGMPMNNQPLRLDLQTLNYTKRSSKFKE